MTSAAQERGGQQMTTPFITLQSTGSDQSADMRDISEDVRFAVREVRRFFGVRTHFGQACLHDACPRSLRRVLADVFCAAALLMLAASSATAWQTAHGNPDNSGAVDIRTAPAKNPSRTLDVPGGIATGVVPVVAPDGSFYIGDRRGDLVAYNADGLPNWGQNLGNFQSIMTSAALGADGSVYVIGYAKIRDHTVSPAITKHIAELHRFSSTGQLIWHVPLDVLASQSINPAVPDVLDFSAPNILRFGNSDVVMVASGLRQKFSEVYLTAISGDSGQVLARQKVTGFQTPDVTGGTDWDIFCFWCGLQPSFSTTVPGQPAEEQLPKGLKLPFPSPVISTPNNGGAQLVVLSDGYQKLTGYIFTGNAFDEAFRTSNKERRLSSTPLAWPNGPLMISAITDKRSEVKFVSPLPAGGSSDQHVAGPTSAAPAAALGNFRFAIVNTGGGVTIMRGAATEKFVALKGGSVAAPAASRNHLFVSTAYALYTLNKANLQEVGEFRWGPNGGTSQPVIGPKGHVYAIAQDRLYIFPPSRLPGVPDADSLHDITSTNPQPLPSPGGSVLADGGMPNPQSLPGIQPTDVQSLPDIQQDLPSKTYKPPVTSSGKRLFACLELDGDDCGNTQMRDVAAAFCQAQGFDRAEDLDVDSRKVVAESLDGRLCSRKKCKVFDQIVCRK
jgi:hypothetical protein